MAETKTTKKASVFETFSAIDCSKHVEKKVIKDKDSGRVICELSYLSWAWAWGIAKSKYPDASFTIYENADGFNYHHDGRTAWVKTGVTIEGQELIEYLPVMDSRNASIPVTRLTSFDVNKAIQRSLTKALARHGLGIYIYAGEDLPMDFDDEQREAVNAKIEEDMPDDFDAELETAISDLKAAKSRKEVQEINARYREAYGTYAKIPNQRYIDALRKMCKLYPKPTK